MIYQYLWVLLWIWDIVSNPPARVINDLQVEARESFANQNYEKAADQYREVVESSIFSDPAGRLNMANAYFLSGNNELAYQNYSILSRVDDPRISALAKSQLGMIALIQADTIEALARFREAILLDRTNPSVIANFEILSYRFSGEVTGESGGEASPKDQPESSPEEGLAMVEVPNDVVVELADQREQLLQNLDRINMSEEQAKSILDAMKVNERQYIYQLRKKEARSGSGRSKRVEW